MKKLLWAMAALWPLSVQAAPVLHILNWSDYIDDQTLSEFHKTTGIDVTYDVFDSNETLENKLMAGNTGYDLVVPTSEPFLARQVALGIYQPLDKSKLPNLKNLDPAMMAIVAKADPDNAHAVPWMWGTVGIGYNIDKVKERLGDVPLNSIKQLLDPAIAKKLADCGIGMLDSPSDIMPGVLNALGLPVHDWSLDNLKKAESALMAIRPYIRKFHSSSYINDLANGDMCVAVGWSGDVFQARARAEEAKNGVHVTYVIPVEGANVWVDSFAIPKDAQNVDEAHQFLNFILQPKVAARNSSAIGYASPNKAAFDLVTADVRTNPSVYPPQDVQAKMFNPGTPPQKYERERTRTWARILKGQ